MKHKYCIPVLSLLISGCFMSCGDDFSPNDDINTNPTEQEKITPSITLSQDEEILLTELSNKTPKISIDQAVEIADNFFGNSSSSTSISKSAKCMPKCEVITASKKTIKKSGSADDIDTLLYILNYNDGFAVVSADIRTPEQILAYSDDGSLHSDTDNPGIQLFLDLAQDYVQYSIDKAESMRDSLENLLDEKISSALGLPADTVASISKAKRVTSKTLVYTNIQNKHISTELVGPYIKTYWHQSYPYNESTPIINGQHCPTGCDAIAVSQLMTYWNKPFADEHKNIINWNLMTENPPNYDYIAYFIAKIGKAINTKYDISSGTSNLNEDIKLLKSYKYKMDNAMDYSFNKIKQSIDNKRPVIIRGSSPYTKDGKQTKVGHCWLIDGYAKEITQSVGEQRYVIMYKDDVTGEISGELQVVPENRTETYYYQHFNWGWGGNERYSYYSTNVFDINREYDISVGKQPEPITNRYKESYDFKYAVRMVTNIYY